MSELIDNIFMRLQTYFNPEALSTALVDALADIIVGVLTFTLFYLLWRVLKVGLQFVLNRTLADETTVSFAQTALQYIVLILGAVQALTTAGVDTAALLGSLGIAGLTIGFAARDALSNLISGLLIFSLCSRWIGLVAMKVCRRLCGQLSPSTAACWRCPIPRSSIPPWPHTPTSPTCGWIST